MLPFLWLASALLRVSLAQAVNCDTVNCPNPVGTSYESKLNCGVLVNDGTNGQSKKCAYMMKTRGEWPESNNFCNSLKFTTNETEIEGGSMLSIRSPAENEVIRQYIIGLMDGQTNIYYYPRIGLRKTCQNCEWYWTDGSPLTYTNWYGTEPNTYYYDCVRFYYSSNGAVYNGTWMDMTCTGIYSDLCQFEVAGKQAWNPEPLAGLPAKGGCKPDWYPFGGYCYKFDGFRVDGGSGFDPAGFLKWNDAKAKCSEDWEGATLALLPTTEHNSLVASLLGPWYFGADPFIGVFNNAYYDYYFSLINEERLMYDNWIPGKPNHAQSTMDKCVVMSWRNDANFHDSFRVGQWNNVYCGTSTTAGNYGDPHPWVCSHEQSSSYSSGVYPTFFTLPDVKCSPGWIPYHSACYKLITDKKPFDDANKYCAENGESAAKGSYLITMWDEYEVEFGKSFFRDDQLPNRKPTDLPEGIWIGLKKNDRQGSDRFEWVDGIPLTRQDWAGDSGNQPCAFMDSETKMYKTSGCSEQKAFICKSEFYDVPINSFEDIDAKLGKPQECPAGWSLLGHHCIRIYEEEQPYAQAAMQCKIQGGNLGSIHSSGYNRIIKDMFTKTAHTENAMWIGMQFKGAFGWTWDDGTGASYFNWESGEPNDWQEAEDCVAMDEIGTWKDSPCRENKPFLCKKIAPTEFCSAAIASKIKSCGFIGVSETECMLEFGCCFDPTIDSGNGNNCFQPKQPVDVGMAAGAAVGVTVFVIAAVAGAYFFYTKRNSPTIGGITNPIA